VATVKDLFPLLDFCLGDKAGNLSTETKTVGLNAGKDEVWKILVGWDRQGGWFTGQSQNLDSNLDNYFPPFDPGTREYPLPDDFHALRSVELVAPEPTSVVLIKRSLDSPEFRLRRQQEAFSQGDILYDIVSQNPGQMVLADYPSGVLNVKLWYTKTATAWTSHASSTAEFPPVFHQLICDWVAQRYILGVSSPKWSSYIDQWNHSVSRAVLSLDRDITGPDIVPGFMG